MEFVRGKRKHIDVIVLYVNSKMSCGLHGVGMKKYTTLAAERSDFTYRLDGTCFVVSVHDGNKTGGICNSFCYLRGSDDAVSLRTQQCYGKAFRLQSFERVQNSMMLHGSGNDMAFALLFAEGRSADKRLVICFAAAGGKKNFLRRTVKYLCHLLPCAKQSCCTALT